MRKLLFLLAVLILLSGCATASRNRGSLSGAISRSNSSDSEDRVIRSTPRPDEEDEQEVEEEVQPTTQIQPYSYSSNRSNYNTANQDSIPDLHVPIWFDAAFSMGSISSSDLYGFPGFKLGVNFQFDQTNMLQLGFGVNHTNVQKTDEFDNSVSNGLTMVDFSLVYKRVTTPKYTFLGHYWILGAGASNLSFSFANSLYDEATGEYISRDNLWGANLFCGTGFHLFNTAPIQIGAEIIPGFYGWGGVTSQGFHNDYFHPMPYLKLAITAKFRIKN